MELLLPAPRSSELYRGAIREALASAWSISQIGRQDTRGWETSNSYLVDDSEGSRAYVRFIGDACVGIAFSDDPTRAHDLDAAISAVPDELRPAAREVGRLPFFYGNGSVRSTALFWSENGRLVGSEPWHVLYTYSGDILRGELLTDDAWRADAAETYDLPAEVGDAILAIVHKLDFSTTPIMVRPEVLDILAPTNAPHRSDALHALFGDVVATCDRRAANRFAILGK